MSDPFDLQRFVDAQADVFDQALGELRRGRKQSHWIWFVFPQVAGLGSSGMAQRYAIRSLDEARAYLRHPVLGPRLVRCVETLQYLVQTSDPVAVFGSVDAVKLRSSLTLFLRAGAPPVFDAALGRWFGGAADPATLRQLAPG